MPRFSSSLLKLPQGFIRRFHGTTTENAERIQREGLKLNPPKRNLANDWLAATPDYEGVYTTVNPAFGYFDPTYEDNALVILDLPKPWYKNAARSATNPELPAPPPKLKRWDEQGLKDAIDEYNNMGGENNRYNLPEGWDDSPTAILEDYRAIVPVQQGGRVDIFKQDIPPEFIREIIIPEGPPPDHTKFKTLIDPDRNLSWDNIIFGNDF